MKRFGVSLAGVFLVSMFVGCGGGGVEVGPPAETPKTSVTSDFREAMEKAGSKMLMKKKPRSSPSETKAGP
jgi:hypothetical protein